MPIPADHIRDVSANYLDTYPEERFRLTDLRDLLDLEVDVTSRAEFRSHIVAGVILLNDDSWATCTGSPGAGLGTPTLDS